MSEPMKACPHCGSKEAYYFSYYHVKQEYQGFFGETRDKEEILEAYDMAPEPVWAKCSACKKRVRLSRIRGEEPTSP